MQRTLHNHLYSSVERLTLFPNVNSCFKLPFVSVHVQYSNVIGVTILYSITFGIL